MIRDGRIAYGKTESPLLYWELENPVLNSLVIALVTTILSYQIAFSFFDLCLGWKRKNLSSLRNLHALLLIRQSRPIPVLSSLIRKDWITRCYFQNQFPSTSTIAREDASVGVSITGRLLLLLAVAPAASVLAIIATLERPSVHTISSVQFGGLGFGLNREFASFQQENITDHCTRAKMNVAAGEHPLSTFVICSNQAKVSSEGSEFPGTAHILVLVLDSHSISFQIVVEETYHGLVLAYLSSETDSYVMAHGIGFDDLTEVIDVGLGILAEKCGLTDPETLHLFPSINENGTERMAMWRLISCPNRGSRSEIAADSLSSWLRYFTFVNAPELQLFPSLNSTNVEDRIAPDDIPLLQRRRRYVGFPILLLATVAMFFFRIVLGITLNNDVGEGLRRISAHQYLAIKSQLRDPLKIGKLRFDHKYQQGVFCHYGLPRPDMRDVKRFTSNSFIGQDFEAFPQVFQVDGDVVVEGKEVEVGLG